MSGTWRNGETELRGRQPTKLMSYEYVPYAHTQATRGMTRSFDNLGYAYYSSDRVTIFAPSTMARRSSEGAFHISASRIDKPGIGVYPGVS